jgi:hypothetical protein
MKVSPDALSRCMRKLRIILNTVLRNKLPWNPRRSRLTLPFFHRARAVIYSCTLGRQFEL